MYKIFLFLFPYLFLFSEATFEPPPGWIQQALEKNSGCVVKSFVANVKKEFPPSINLAVEKTSLSLKEYLKAVKELHEKTPGAIWRDLGTHATKAGEAKLTSVDLTLPQGKARLFQLILMKEGHAYVLTAAALQKDQGISYSIFQKAFSSLSINPN